MRYRFYVYERNGGRKQESKWPDGCQVSLWRPKGWSVVPPGCGIMPFVIWWAFHVFRVFRNRQYSVLLIHGENGLVHRSCVFPGYFRFPFMAAGDLQVGDTFTTLSHRGRGIALAALSDISTRFCLQGQGGMLWYIVRDDNVASIRVAEKCGFRLVGYGMRVSRCGLRVLGSYSLERIVESSEERGDAP